MLKGISTGDEGRGVVKRKIVGYFVHEYFKLEDSSTYGRLLVCSLRQWSQSMLKTVSQVGVPH